MTQYDENLCKELFNYIKEILTDSNFDYQKIIQDNAILALSEIKKIVFNEELSDFQVIENILLVLNKYSLSVIDISL